MNKQEILKEVKANLSTATATLVGGPEMAELELKLSAMTKAELNSLNALLKSSVIDIAALNKALSTTYVAPSTPEPVVEEAPVEEVVEEAPVEEETTVEEPVVETTSTSVEKANWFKRLMAFLFKKHLATTIIAIVATAIIVALSIILVVNTTSTAAPAEPVVETTEYYSVETSDGTTTVTGLLYTVTGEEKTPVILYVDGDYTITYTTGDDTLNFNDIVVNVEKSFTNGASALTVIDNSLYIVNGTNVNIIPGINNIELTTTANITFGVNESIHTLYNVINSK